MTAELEPVSPPAAVTPVEPGATSQPPATPAPQPVEKKARGRKPKASEPVPASVQNSQTDPEPVPASVPPVITPPPAPDTTANELVPAPGFGPGRYKCLHKCYGDITYVVGKEYTFESNPDPKKFVRVGD